MERPFSALRAVNFSSQHSTLITQLTEAVAVASQGQNPQPLWIREGATIGAAHGPSTDFLFPTTRDYLPAVCPEHVEWAIVTVVGFAPFCTAQR